MVLPCPHFSCPRLVVVGNLYKGREELAVFPLLGVHPQQNCGNPHLLVEYHRVLPRNVYIHHASTHMNISAFFLSISALNLSERIDESVGSVTSEH